MYIFITNTNMCNGSFNVHFVLQLILYFLVANYFSEQYSFGLEFRHNASHSMYVYHIVSEHISHEKQCLTINAISQKVIQASASADLNAQTIPSFYTQLMHLSSTPTLFSPECSRKIRPFHLFKIISP